MLDEKCKATGRKIESVSSYIIAIMKEVGRSAVTARRPDKLYEYAGTCSYTKTVVGSTIRVVLPMLLSTRPL